MSRKKNLPSVKPDLGDPVSMLESELRLFSDRVDRLKHVVQGEEATKMSFIVPFLLKLGWDVYNPLEVVPEYVCDVGIKKGEKVDYALIVNESPAIILEAKDWKQSLSGKMFSQLYRYFVTSESKIGVITNGIEYQFYTDSIKENIMDESPFFSFSLEHFTYEDVSMLMKFDRSQIENGGIDLILENMQMNNSVYEIQKWLESQVEQPSSSFVRLIRSSVLTTKLSNAMTVKVIKQALSGICFGETGSGLCASDTFNAVEERESTECYVKTGTSLNNTSEESTKLSDWLGDVKTETGIYHLQSALECYPVGCKLLGVSFDGRFWYTCREVSNIHRITIDILLDKGLSLDSIISRTKSDIFEFSLNGDSYRNDKVYKGLHYEGNFNGKDHIKRFKVTQETLGVSIDNIILCFINSVEMKSQCRGFDNVRLIQYVREKCGVAI